MTQFSIQLKKILFLFLVVLSLLVFKLNGDCSFTDSGKTLDITNLGQFQSTYKQWTFLAEECANNLKCNSESAMAIQDNSGTCTSYLAKYNSDNKPSYSSKNGGTWSFNYKNGESSDTCGGSRKLNLYFICTKSSAAYDSSATYVEEDSSAKCTYNWYVYTQYACVSGSSSSSTDDGELSGGSWMLLLIFIFLFLYCVVGYVWNVRKSDDQDWKDIKGNTPHLTFWCMIPKWTWAGCCVTKEWTMAKYQQYRGGGNGEMLTAGSDDEEEA